MTKSQKIMKSQKNERSKNEKPNPRSSLHSTRMPAYKYNYDHINDRMIVIIQQTRLSAGLLGCV
jgi:hypothetical protein